MSASITRLKALPKGSALDVLEEATAAAPDEVVVLVAKANGEFCVHMSDATSKTRLIGMLEWMKHDIMAAGE